VMPVPRRRTASEKLFVIIEALVLTAAALRSLMRRLWSRLVSATRGTRLRSDTENSIDP
jgi:hypothetical protein